MAEKLYINKIRLNGQDYYIKDEEARAAASAGLQLIAVESYEALGLAGADTMGAIYLVPHSHGRDDIWDEYVTVLKDGSYTWERLGTTDVDLSGYAKDNHTHQVQSNVSVEDISYTPEGDIEVFVTAPQIEFSGSGEYGGESISYTPSGTVTAPVISSQEFKGDEVTFDGKFTPRGDISVDQETTDVMDDVSVSASDVEASYDKFSADYQADGEMLILAHAETSATVTQPTISVTPSKRSVVYNIPRATFTGTEDDIGVKGTPTGTIAVELEAPEFTGDQTNIGISSARISVSGTAMPDISATAEFSGKAASLHPVVTNGTVTSSVNSK